MAVPEICEAFVQFVDLEKVLFAHQSLAKYGGNKKYDVRVADYEAKMSFLNDCMFSTRANIIQNVVWIMSDWSMRGNDRAYMN